MAKVLPNGAVISNDNLWLWTGADWAALGVPGESKKPDRVQTDHAKTLAGPATQDEITVLVTEVLEAIQATGSLASARSLLSERHASESPPELEPQSIEVEIDPEILVKSYASPKEFESDSKEMTRKGWQPENQSTLAGHINVRRTAARVVLGGFLIGGASRSKDQMSVTWVRRRTERRRIPSGPQAQAAPKRPTDTPDDIAAQIHRLAELHAQGILTDEEFATKKAELLARM